MIICATQPVTIKGRYFPGKVMDNRMKPYTHGVTTWLAEGSIVLEIHVVERRRGTLNYSTWELHDVGVVHRRKMSQGLWWRSGGCAAAWVDRKVTAGVTIHDVMLHLRPNGVGSRNLRRALWVRFGKIYHHESINEPNLGGTVELEFKRCYKLQRATQQKTLGHLWIELLYASCILRWDLFALCWALIEPLITRLKDSWTNKMVVSQEVMEISEMTTEEVA